jgi:hypothetical protein
VVFFHQPSLLVVFQNRPGCVEALHRLQCLGRGTISWPKRTSIVACRAGCPVLARNCKLYVPATGSCSR